MPWKETCVTDERIAFVAACLTLNALGRPAPTARQTIAGRGRGLSSSWLAASPPVSSTGCSC